VDRARVRFGRESPMASEKPVPWRKKLLSPMAGDPRSIPAAVAQDRPALGLCPSRSSVEGTRPLPTPLNPAYSQIYIFKLL